MKNGMPDSRHPILIGSVRGLTGTPLAYSKKQDLWGMMSTYMVEGLSVRKAGARLGVDKSTSFRWRHKLLGIRHSMPQPVLGGVIEADETYFKESFKGMRELQERLGRPPRKRGGRANKRGLSPEQVCVLTARDRQAQSIFAVTGKGQPTSARVKDVLLPVMQAESVLCTDGAFQYRCVCREVGFEHRPIDGKKRLKGSIYHINNINGYHSRLKTWMVRFKGGRNQVSSELPCVAPVRGSSCQDESEGRRKADAGGDLCRALESKGSLTANKRKPTRFKVRLYDMEVI